MQTYMAVDVHGLLHANNGIGDDLHILGGKLRVDVEGLHSQGAGQGHLVSSSREGALHAVETVISGGEVDSSDVGVVARGADVLDLAGGEAAASADAHGGSLGEVVILGQVVPCEALSGG